MKQKMRLAFTICEVVAVALITDTAFRWGRATALAERGYTAYGGEYLLLLIPLIYYAGKPTVLDWIMYIRKKVAKKHEP